MVIKIVVKNTYFTITSDNFSELKQSLGSLTSSLKSYKMEFNRRIRRVIRVPDKDFFSLNADKKEYIFPITVLVRCITELSLRGYKVDRENIDFNKSIPISTFKWKMKDTFKPRDYQSLYIDAVIDPESPMYTLIDLKPGAGKTFIAMNAVTKLKMRTGIVILPKYIEKWIDDVSLYTDIPKDRVYVVRGNDSIKHLLYENNDYDIIIFSLRTLYNYNKMFEEGSRLDCPPWELFNTLKIGVLLSDESHQELSALSKVIMYSNVKKIIGLSATFITNQADEKRLQDIVFPPETRISNLVKFDKYIEIYGVKYELQTHYKIKDSNGQGYNHMMFEMSIMKQHDLFLNYLDMIKSYVDDVYIDDKKPEDKCLIFFSTIDACTKATMYFQKHYPKLKVKRYVGEDEYSDMMSGEIIVSTPGEQN